MKTNHLYLATSIAPYASLKLVEGINGHLAQTSLILLSNATQHTLPFKSAVVILEAVTNAK